jgi:DNA/RNA endonuclease G (NUC1)
MFQSLASRKSLPVLWPVIVAGLSEGQQQQRHRSTLAAAESLPSLADFAPFSPIRVMRPNQNLEIAFDVRTRNPLYVLERLVVVDDDDNDDNKAAAKKKKVKRPNFYQDNQNLPAVYRSQKQHYHNSGYDRGHMAPAADFTHDPSAYRDTFNYCNISPQDSVLNQTTWARLEDWTRQVATHGWQREQATTYVVTGPLWLPKRQIGPKAFQYAYSALGQPPSLVAVPSHFFKVVVVVKNDKVLRFACFVMANVAPPLRESRDLPSYLVRWGDLEATTGLQFFPNLVDEAWKQRANRLLSTLLLPPPSSSPKTPLLLTSGERSSSQ